MSEPGIVAVYPANNGEKQVTPDTLNQVSKIGKTTSPEWVCFPLLAVGGH